MADWCLGKRKIATGREEQHLRDLRVAGHAYSPCGESQWPGVFCNRDRPTWDMTVNVVPDRTMPEGRQSGPSDQRAGCAEFSGMEPRLESRLNTGIAYMVAADDEAVFCDGFPVGDVRT